MTPVDCFGILSGYFRLGKISRKCYNDVSRGANFRDTSLILLIKSYWLYFCVGEIFVKKTILRKSQKLPPRENFHVYSNCRTDVLGE